VTSYSIGEPVDSVAEFWLNGLSHVGHLIKSFNLTKRLFSYSGQSAGPSGQSGQSV